MLNNKLWPKEIHDSEKLFGLGDFEVEVKGVRVRKALKKIEKHVLYAMQCWNKTKNNASSFSLLQKTLIFSAQIVESRL